MESFIEILKYTLPALVVFVTVYSIMKSFMKNQLAIESLKFKQKNINELLPLKLQAYERLALFAERISVDNLSYRLSSAGMDAGTLSSAMVMGIQQEYEHNLSQQIYVSDKLWEIVTLAKNQNQEIIAQAADQVGENGTAAQLIGEISKLMQNAGVNPISHLRKAIKKEIEIVL